MFLLGTLVHLTYTTCTGVIDAGLYKIARNKTAKRRIYYGPDDTAQSFDFLAGDGCRWGTDKVKWWLSELNFYLAMTEH